MKGKNILSAVLSFLMVISIFTGMTTVSYQAKYYEKTLVKNVPKKVISTIKEKHYNPISNSELKEEDIEVYFYKPLKKNLALINYEGKNFCYVDVVYFACIGDYYYCVPSVSDMVDIIDLNKRKIFDIKEYYEKGKINDKDLKKISKYLSDFPNVEFKKPELSYNAKTMKTGESYKLKIKCPTDVFCVANKWSSSDNSVAKVNKKGKVTALREGVATITATLKEFGKLKCKITVKAKNK